MEMCENLLCHKNLRNKTVLLILAIFLVSIIHYFSHYVFILLFFKVSIKNIMKT